MSQTDTNAFLESTGPAAMDETVNSSFCVIRGCKLLLTCLRCSFFDQSRNLFRPGDVDRVAGTWDFDLVTVGSCGIPAFEVGVDGSVFCRYQHPAWFTSPRRSGDDRFETVGCVGYLRSRHESGLLNR
jgi:hypothetical protein